MTDTDTPRPGNASSSFAGPQERRFPPLDVEGLRHPTEPSRFALAVLAASLGAGAFVFVSLVIFELTVVIGYIVGLLFFLGLVWLSLQIWRIRLLGSAVRVSEESFPELQDAVEEVRDRLSYRHRVDLYVVNDLSPPIQLSSYFGTRVLMVEGGAVSDLTQQANRPELVFLLSSYFGALKARHARWTPALLVFNIVGLAKVLNLFINTWQRATVFTGDQIAYACCGDLEVSLRAVRRLLVGKEMAKQVRADGLVGQSAVVRRSKLLRFSQLFMPSPHATNRYLNLLAFADVHHPDELQAFRGSLTPLRASSVDTVLPLVRRRPSSGTSAQAGLVVAACIMVLALTAGAAAHGSEWARMVRATIFGSSMPAPDPVDKVEPASVSSATVDLLQRVPAELQSTCEPTTAPRETRSGLVAALDCTPEGSDTPDSVFFYAYDQASTMSQAFEAWAGELPDGSCADGTARTTWRSGGLSRGQLACYETDDGKRIMVWTHDDDRILVLAQATALSPADLFSWWRTSASLEPPA